MKDAYLTVEERITKEEALSKIDGMLEDLTNQDTERYISESIKLMLDLVNSLGSLEVEWSAMMDQAANMLTLVVDEMSPGQFQAKVPHRKEGYEGGIEDVLAGTYLFGDYHQACRAALVAAEEQAKLIDDIEDAKKAFEEGYDDPTGMLGMYDTELPEEFTSEEGGDE